jgi:B12-binding domain/radical SAM domain protein
MRNPFQRDLILLHAPALYDFRLHPTFLGPVADAVPSTAIFEMYPVGLTSIAAYLERNHYNVEIVNVAYRMLQDLQYDVDAHLRGMSAPVFGIDLHWLPHVQGALALAERVKALHPDSLVLIGGLSASYYHEELARYPYVDFVLRGDSTEEPVRQLLQALRESTPLGRVENLTWKRADRSVVVNPLTYVPADLDDIEVPAYAYLLRSMFKYHSLRNLIPHLEWLRYPITLLLTARGCTQDCAVCGGSRSAYRQICGRQAPAFRSPEKLAADVRTIASFSRAPIFMVHDPRMGGMPRAERLLGLLKDLKPRNEIIFELYAPAGDNFFDLVQDSLPAWSVEMTLEAPDEALRRRNGKFACSNALVEATMQSALAHGCRRLDVFFMVGLPHQTYADALGIAEYAEHLIERVGADGRLRAYVAPLAPFLDPGSRAFERPELGVSLFCRTLEDHRQACLRDGWQRVLSYETDAMTRDQIAAATYEVAGRLNAIKHAHGLIDEKTFADVADHLAVARQVLQESGPWDARRIDLANHATMFGDDELKSPLHLGFRIGATLVRSLAAGLALELGHTAARLAGRYDTAIIPARL